jgi:hypothetical protein
MVVSLDLWRVFKPPLGRGSPNPALQVLVMQAGISKGKKKSTINPQGFFSPSSTPLNRGWNRKVNGSLVKNFVAPFAVVPKHSIFSQPPSLSKGGGGIKYGMGGQPKLVPSKPG